MEVNERINWALIGRFKATLDGEQKRVFEKIMGRENKREENKILDRLLSFVVKSNYIFLTPELQAETRRKIDRLHELIRILSSEEIGDNKEVSQLLTEIEDDKGYRGGGYNGNENIQM